MKYSRDNVQRNGRHADYDLTACDLFAFRLLNMIIFDQNYIW